MSIYSKVEKIINLGNSIANWNFIINFLYWLDNYLLNEINNIMMISNLPL